jgi:hypothetical protein
LANLSDLLLVLILIFDLVVSVWNAYASGVTWALVRGQTGQRFTKAAAVAGLGLAFTGMAYALIIVISYVALFLGLLGTADFLFLVSFDFLVLGAMIIGFGLVVTAQSVAIAVQERRWGSIGIAAWNVFAEAWDLAIYAEGFRDAATVVSQGRNRINLYAIVAVALGVSFIITYVAFRHGVRKGESALPAGAAGPGASAGRLSHPHALRIIVVVAVAVVAVVIAVILVLVFVIPTPKVQVGEIDVWAPRDVCGLGANPVFYQGFNDSPGSSDSFALQVHNFNATSCTITGVTTNTSGFGLADVGVPLTVPGGGNSTLNLTVVLPGSSWSGSLNLIYT